MQVAQGSDPTAAPDLHEMRNADHSSELINGRVPTAWALQMVDRLDQGAIPMQVVAQSYDALWKLVSKALYRTHVEGKLKARSPCIVRRAFFLFCHARRRMIGAGIMTLQCVAVQAEIIQDPASFVELDPEMAYTLLDLKRAVRRIFPNPMHIT